MMQYPLTLPHLLERAGRYYGSVEIVSRLPDKRLHRYTYTHFVRRARSLAQALQRAGLKKGDRVGTLMWNHYAHLEAYFGIPASGGVLHTINLRLHPNEIAYIINHGGDRFLIVDDVLLPLLEKVADRIRVERVFVVPLTGQPVPPGYEDYEEFIREPADDFTYPNLDENDALGMCYTSGTTGRPKGVVYSHRAVVLHSFASAMADTLAVSGRDAVLPVVPMFHVNAWGLPFTMTMVGAKQVYPGPHLDPVSLLELMQEEQVTFAAGVPTIWFGIYRELEKQPGHWRLHPELRTVVGGAAAPEVLLRGMDRHGIHVVHAWGMTETTPLGTISVLKPHLRSLPEDEQYAYRAKQGIPAPFVDVRVVNEQGEVPPDGVTMGELQVRGPWIAGAYHDKPNTRDSFTEDGWFRTGDVATIDEEGYVKITDRTKDLIKSGGEWISSVDLENAIMSHPAVEEAAVIGIAHPKWQERPLAVVVKKEEATLTLEELHAFLAPKFAKWWLPDDVVFVEEIPRTSAGKFLKSLLREQFHNHFLTKGVNA
ncbi:long-chain fatty acid--CoA ligase [Polycladomyces sp. WAk]|uniref:Long-chain fatty acid--CoA ligase n=2 Tax=Polycladomyces zharkentensis TaxID=2807616 RepID=A0ABS2WNC4_9BACL|nr:long-chain fatty acid--CoA ligase [Polycladomyces sp. WAk]MBN2910889.1 long-chain fatty acid--CoA ligase [Polycladomyces sp. WAk]